ncbi:MAG: rhomboid family intramembrane serine protease [Chloroflexi bacterium]|jgi:membrane associated rhomboid family serine protease|nr:rhomboid family intramembrane serine protease [Chloroflexota bacterium]MCH2536782.1 rhomboid family intramembrane serine protease [Dehalococcoidia bacterium]MEE2927641.1 rhomboid family intramembrane serine protease [Chloroflexota bacterium]|tara:strand:+ start:521 stop:1096 length:576 start_codon:yes stop_codon:yes gene_type:complete
MKLSVIWIFGSLAVMWVVEIINGFIGHRLSLWGILPRTTPGLIGIPLSPFLHGSFNHVLSNTIPFLVLGGLVGLRGGQKLVGISLFIIVAGGAGVWLLGRPAVHVGASGLVFGYFGYLVANGWFDRRPLSILAAIAVIVVYGSLVFGVIPTTGFVSWEAHLFGLLAGVLAARLTRRGRNASPAIPTRGAIE